RGKGLTPIPPPRPSPKGGGRSRVNDRLRNMTDALDPIKFGTDGWRAEIARAFTFANVERVAQAYADYLASELKGAPSEFLVVVGYDRRFHSENFAQRAAEILAGNDFQIAMFSEAVPTPIVSWAVKDQGAVGGIMI